MLTIVIAVIGGLLGIYIVLSAVLGGVLVKSFSYSRNASVAETMTGGLERGEFTQEFLDRPREEFVLTSEFGYPLRGVYWKGPEGADKTVILVHGHTATWVGMGKYAMMFLRRGWNVAAYSHRRHGDSGGPATTGGYYEKHDLKKVADFVWDTFPGTKTFGVYGESMGAATVLQYMPLDEGRLNFVVADCPYSDGPDLFSHMLDLNHIPGFLKPGAMAMGALWMRLFARFPMKGVSPRQSAQEAATPLLLIHGGADTYVPTEMSREIHQLRHEKAPTEIHIMPEAKHAVSIQQDWDLYESWVADFMNTHVLPDKSF